MSEEDAPIVGIPLSAGDEATVGLYANEDFITRVTRTPLEEAVIEEEAHNAGVVLPEYDDFMHGIAPASFGDWLCQIWRAVLKLIDSVVDTVIDIVTKVGGAALRLLTDVIKVAADGLSSLFSSPGGLLLLAAGGFGLWWLLGRKKEDKTDSTVDAGRTARYIDVGPVEREQIPTDPKELM